MIDLLRAFVALALWFTVIAIVWRVAIEKRLAARIWMFAAGLTGPFALLAVLVAPARELTEAERLQSGELRRCPSCAELVRARAVRCRFCDTELPSRETTRPPQRRESAAPSSPDRVSVRPRPR